MQQRDMRRVDDLARKNSDDTHARAQTGSDDSAGKLHFVTLGGDIWVRVESGGLTPMDWVTLQITISSTRHTVAVVMGHH